MSKSLAVMAAAAEVQSKYKDGCFQVSSAGSIVVFSDKQNTPRFATENKTRMLLYAGASDVSLSLRLQTRFLVLKYGPIPTRITQ
jgi:hypothetical protein